MVWSQNHVYLLWLKLYQSFLWETSIWRSCRSTLVLAMDKDVAPVGAKLLKPMQSRFGIEKNLFWTFCPHNPSSGAHSIHTKKGTYIKPQNWMWWERTMGQNWRNRVCQSQLLSSWQAHLRKIPKWLQESTHGECHHCARWHRVSQPQRAKDLLCQHWRYRFHPSHCCQKFWVNQPPGVNFEAKSQMSNDRYASRICCC